MINETVKHYDMEINFFKEFLDPYMKYTSGLYEKKGEPLEVATRRMLDTIIDSGNLNNSSRVLEIGPGWGAFLRRLIERDISCYYEGVSPSEVQNNYIQKFAGINTKLFTTTFEDYVGQDKEFDAIILIGSFCHLQNKQEQLIKMNQLLSHNGVIIIEDTFFVTEEAYQKHKHAEETKFVQEKIFGYAEILSLSTQLDQISKAGLKVSYMLEHSDSYKLTISEWIKKLEAMEASSYPKALDFIKYMKIAQKGWNYTTINQLLVLKKMS
jgi:cyclopropane-fatty-acyl-phospholipid synthase